VQTAEKFRQYEYCYYYLIKVSSIEQFMDMFLINPSSTESSRGKAVDTPVL
jgi:hypothetical protein